MTKENFLALMQHDPVKIKQEKLDWEKTKYLLDYQCKMAWVNVAKYGIDTLVSALVKNKNAEKNTEKKIEYVPERVVYVYPNGYVEERYVGKRLNIFWGEALKVACFITPFGFGLWWVIKWLKENKNTQQVRQLSNTKVVMRRRIVTPQGRRVMRDLPKLKVRIVSKRDINNRFMDFR